MPKYQRSVKGSEHLADSVLEKVLTEMIARDLGINPEDVTPEFIHKWREEHLYPKALVNLTTRYGGYNSGGRRALTGAEVQSNKEKAEAFLSQFSKSDLER